MESLDIARTCARIAADKKASGILILEVRDLTGIADYFVMATARNRRQLKAVADQIRVDLKEQGVHHVQTEGRGSDRWVLLDYGPVVVHLFDARTRSYYDLESLWADAPRVPVPELGGQDGGSGDGDPTARERHRGA